MQHTQIPHEIVRVVSRVDSLHPSVCGIGSMDRILS